MESKRAVVYARLSVTTDESVSIAQQLESGRQYAALRGWTVVAEHVDDGVSASSNAPEARRGWRAVLAMPPGSFDMVVVFKIDRLARRAFDFLQAHKTLEERGAAIAAVQDPIDMSTVQGKGFATMLAVFAEMEAEGTRVRVRAARRALLKAGRVPGGAAPFGYWNAPNPDGAGKILAKDDEKISFVIEAAGRILRGDSLGSVCTWLDEVCPLSGRKNSAAYWTTTVTKRMLSNPVLAGMTSFNPGNVLKERGKDVLRDESGMPIIREDLAILTVEEFRTLQANLTKHETRRGDSESFLSGLVWCGDCGRKMYRNAKNIRGERIRVFQCQGKAGCGQQVSRLEEIVRERFLSEFGELNFFRSVPVATDHDVTEINRQIAETTVRMGDDDADLDQLVERVKSLKAAKAKAPEQRWTIETSTKTFAEKWEDDEREALLARFGGVQLVRGRVGRKFDQNRLSFLPRTVRLAPGEIESTGLSEAEMAELGMVVEHVTIDGVLEETS